MASLEAGTVESITIDPNGDTILALKNSKPELMKPEPAESKEEREKGWDKNVTYDREIHYLVSSRQLRLVSTFFENIWKQLFSEATPDPEDGKYHVSAQHWNSKVLTIVLNIIHAKSWEVPDAIKIEELVEIMVIADYYKMEKAMIVPATRWWRVMDGLWIENNRQAVMLMFVAMKLEKHELFADAVSKCMKVSVGRIDSLGLPFSSNFMKILHGRQRHALTSLIRKVRLRLKLLQEDADEKCSPCQSLQLGWLTRGLARSEVAKCLLKSPEDMLLESLSFRQLRSALQDIGSPPHEWKDCPKPPSSKHVRSLAITMRDLIEHAEKPLRILAKDVKFNGLEESIKTRQRPKRKQQRTKP